ncbi:MAG: energy-coupled thiamine transporter ThiT [Clostridia bacterium]|nr:energy-coupled thiamine transporter ThiT [Clostridia bacterium]
MARNKKLVVLCEGAVLVALSYALSFIKIPIGVSFGGFGGSIDLVMIPLLVFALRRGAWQGLVAGLVFGTLKYFFAGGSAVNWQSMLLDYSLAYMAVGAAGLLKGEASPLRYALGALVGCVARFAVHFVSGVTIYAQYMPETMLGITLPNPTVYSIIYNGTYMLPNTVLAVALLAALALPLKKIKL